MATLKTNYKDDVLDSSMSLRQWNKIDNVNGTVSFSDASLYSTTGDGFGASDINATNTQVNANTTALGGCTVYEDSGNFYIKKGTTTKKLGSSEGTATTAQVLSGATFNSANTPDNVDYSTGTMANKSGATVTATALKDATDGYSYIKVPTAGYYDTNSTLKVDNKKLVNANPNIAKIIDLGTGTSFNVTSLATKYGFDYTKLTNTNFLVTNTASVSGNIDGGDSNKNGFWWGASSWFSITPSASYNSSNGVFTCSCTGTFYIQKREAHDEYHTASSQSLSVTPHVYLVIGNIATS